MWWDLSTTHAPYDIKLSGKQSDGRRVDRMVRKDIQIQQTLMLVALQHPPSHRQPARLNWSERSLNNWRRFQESNSTRSHAFTRAGVLTVRQSRSAPIYDASTLLSLWQNGRWCPHSTVTWWGHWVFFCHYLVNAPLFCCSLPHSHAHISSFIEIYRGWTKLYKVNREKQTQKQ